MTFKPFDVVVVPFPFTDKQQSKRRPALVVSKSRQFNTPAGHSILAMITTHGHRHWPSDVEITDLDAASLPVESLVRMKLFTLDHELVLRRIGRLSSQDAKQVKRSLSQLFPL